jgi:hypothetical protein
VTFVYAAATGTATPPALSFGVVSQRIASAEQTVSVTNTAASSQPPLTVDRSCSQAPARVITS